MKVFLPGHSAGMGALTLAATSPWHRAVSEESTTPGSALAFSSLADARPVGLCVNIFRVGPATWDLTMATQIMIDCFLRPDPGLSQTDLANFNF